MTAHDPPLSSTGWIVLFSVHHVTFEIDGEVVRDHEGYPHQVPVAPGVHKVSAWTTQNFGGHYGKETLDFVVPPGVQVPVHYTPQVWVYGHGAIGHVPQQSTAAPHWGDLKIAVIGVAAIVGIIIVSAVVRVLLGFE